MPGGSRASKTWSPSVTSLPSCVSASFYSSLQLSSANRHDQNAPLHEGTKGLFNKDLISKMKKGSWLVNTARGAICDRQAVADAIKSGHLNGYAGDVWGEAYLRPWPSSAFTELILIFRCPAFTQRSRLATDGQPSRSVPLRSCIVPRRRLTTADRWRKWHDPAHLGYVARRADQVCHWSARYHQAILGRRGPGARQFDCREWRREWPANTQAQECLELTLPKYASKAYGQRNKK